MHQPCHICARSQPGSHRAAHTSGRIGGCFPPRYAARLRRVFPCRRGRKIAAALARRSTRFTIARDNPPPEHSRRAAQKKTDGAQFMADISHSAGKQNHQLVAMNGSPSTIHERVAALKSIETSSNSFPRSPGSPRKSPRRMKDDVALPNEQLRAVEAIYARPMTPAPP